MTISGLKEFFANEDLENVRLINRMHSEDYVKLGPEIHAASHVLKLGGRCRLHGSPRWLKLEDDNIKNLLPQEKRKNLFVEALDLSKTVVQCEGIENFGKIKFVALVLNYLS